ncbi:MAG: 4-alpha-glucanotransferase [Peptostreptococcus russellii]
MRKAGVLLPIFSLPSKYGIGSLGKEAYNFIDFLVESGQSVWQILPVTSTSKKEYYSPYKTNGAFSGNYDFIDIDILIEEGLLSFDFINSINISNYKTDPRYVDYDKVRDLKQKILYKAYENFISGKLYEEEDYIDFANKNSFWLDEYCEYMSLRKINGDKAYWEWEKVGNFQELCKKKDDQLMKDYKNLFDYHKFLQYKFYDQWLNLKKYANENGVEIFGDIPIYISQDSSDFYFHKEMFLIDKDGEPSSISGVPPDAFSSEGQCWGNPLYDWKYLSADKYDWWIKRIKKSLEIYDILRIDHFRGFESFYSIDKSTENAKLGEWMKGPGKDFFDTLSKEVPNANIIAEDLGLITDEVRELLDYTGFPGMKVIEFAFDSDSNNLNLPHRYYKNTVAYTATHDNMTLLEWLENKANTSEMEYAQKYLRLESYDKYTEAFIRAVLGSCSDLAIIPIQDWLDFGSWARINTPSTIGINWKFRLLEGEINKKLIEYISEISGIYGRYFER